MKNQPHGISGGAGFWISPLDIAGKLPANQLRLHIAEPHGVASGMLEDVGAKRSGRAAGYFHRWDIETARKLSKFSLARSARQRGAAVYLAERDAGIEGSVGEGQLYRKIRIGAGRWLWLRGDRVCG